MDQFLSTVKTFSNKAPAVIIILTEGSRGCGDLAIISDLIRLQSSISNSRANTASSFVMIFVIASWHI